MTREACENLLYGYNFADWNLDMTATVINVTDEEDPLRHGAHGRGVAIVDVLPGDFDTAAGDGRQPDQRAQHGGLA